MKTRYILATALLFSIGAFAQKDEFKTLKKIYDKGQPSTKDLIKYKETVTAASSLVSASNEEDVIYLNFYKSGIPFMEMLEAMSKPENQANPNNALKFFTPEKILTFSTSAQAVMDYEKKTGKTVLTKNILENVSKYKPTLVSYAVTLSNEKRFSDASLVLYSIYKLDTKDTEKLYYAAGYAVNAKEYKKALEYYQILKDLDYSGEKTNYMATSKLNDDVVSFASKLDRDNAVKLGTHTLPKEEKEPSKRGEIYKNIALILVSENKIEEAKKAITDARLANPDDVSLIISEADIYLKTNDMATYAKLIKEVIEKDPTNADLFFNLGVVSAQNNGWDNAEKYYLKANSITPTDNSYNGIAIVKIEKAKNIETQMAKLGMSAAENKKYDSLKIERDNLLKEAATNLEKSIQLNGKNRDVKLDLLSVYKALEMKEKAKALDAEINK
ncbi:hypothetical protein [Flavobacterium sp.]|uniref:tetratricopeptide repeat protein n=1 Tax=Flavobacterium sp. TaxID=239 RepID=UPI002622391D|nr:hypothetical protein [Flavobacterium sp.]MDD3004117.1 hypothetical protein [Flavobacterium sp.]